MQPEFWPTGLGGYDNNGKWQDGFDAYAKYFHRVATTLNPCGKKPFLSGPGWGELPVTHAHARTHTSTQSAMGCQVQTLSHLADLIGVVLVSQAT